MTELFPITSPRVSCNLRAVVGPFRCLVADPPWDVERGPPASGDGEKWGRPDGRSGGAARPLEYPTMSVADIAGLPVRELMAADSHCFIWTINKYIEETYDIARAWGFEPSTMLYWLKTPMGIGLGGTFSLCVEPVLFARRGTLTAKRRFDRNWWNWPRGRHSAKPEDFQTMVESVSHGPFLEMFARRPRDGWTVFGNEIEANEKDEGRETNP